MSETAFKMNPSTNKRGITRLLGTQHLVITREAAISCLRKCWVHKWKAKLVGDILVGDMLVLRERHTSLSSLLKKTPENLAETVTRSIFR